MTFEQTETGDFYINGVQVPEDVFLDEHTDYPALPSGATRRWLSGDVMMTGTHTVAWRDHTMPVGFAHTLQRKGEQYRTERDWRYPYVYEDHDRSNQERDRETRALLRERGDENKPPGKPPEPPKGPRDPVLSGRKKGVWWEDEQDLILNPDTPRDNTK